MRSLMSTQIPFASTAYYYMNTGLNLVWWSLPLYALYYNKMHITIQHNNTCVIIHNRTLKCVCHHNTDVCTRVKNLLFIQQSKCITHSLFAYSSIYTTHITTHITYIGAFRRLCFLKIILVFNSLLCYHHHHHGIKCMQCSHSKNFMFKNCRQESKPIV